MDRNSRARAPDAQLNLAWWIDQLASCKATADVIRLCGEFMDAWPREKIEALPAQCAPRHLSTTADIADYAYVLARAQLSGAHRAPHIHAIAIFFREASDRLSALLGDPVPNDAPRLFFRD